MSQMDRPWRERFQQLGARLLAFFRRSAEDERRARLEHLGAALVALLFALLMTWPLAPQGGDHLLRAIFHWDAYTNTMIMAGHVDALLGRAPLSLYDAYYFAPLDDAIVFNENLFGLSLFYAPFYLLSGNPLWAYNATLMLSLSASVFFTYLLVKRLTGSALAGMLSGVAFAFSPYVFFEIGRIQLAATQWIPACFLMLHRTFDGHRLRDALGFGACCLLQIGTCLYYAMFLLPLLGFLAAMLIVRERPPRLLYGRLALVGVLVAAVALAMVFPYFSAREAFVLERTESFASSYDGKLSFFANVHDTNRTLTALHHPTPMRGAPEEIAFPGFVVLLTGVVGLVASLWRAFRSGPRGALGATGEGLLVALLALGASLLLHTVLPGLLLVAAWFGWRRWRASTARAGGHQITYVGLSLLATLMFLGLEPLEFRGEPVRGLYYYFHTYFPGFNGIRKVSRQAVMTSFAFCVLAGFGSSWLLGRFARGWARGAAALVLLLATAWELRCFPHPLVGVWAEDSLPAAYRYLRGLPEEDIVAALPQNEGARVFRGDAGLALHNYLMVAHRHRSVNGQGSWQPTATQLADRALSRLPDGNARRMLELLGVRHLVVHEHDLPERRRDLPARLVNDPHWRRVFQEGGISVFTLTRSDDPTLAMLDVPTLPASARALDPSQMVVRANVAGANAGRLQDGDPSTAWSTGRVQARGQGLEVELFEPKTIVAIELRNPQNLTHLPLSFELRAKSGAGPWRTLVERPELRLHRELVHSPRTFVWRVVLPEPVLADRLRLVVRQPVPGLPLTIHEFVLFAEGG